MDIIGASQSCEDLASILSSIKNNLAPLKTLDDIQRVISFLPFHEIDSTEYIFKDVLPAMVTAMQQIYIQNERPVESINDDMSYVKLNLKAAETLLDNSHHILNYITNSGTVPLIYIPSVPVNVGNIVLLTFQHCKLHQKRYNIQLKSGTEILNVFRKTQEVHTTYLTFFDLHLTFDLENEGEAGVLQAVLGIIHRISEALSGVNMKSLTDNWKAYIMLLQKYTTNGKSFDVSAPIKSLTQEIDNQICSIHDLESVDVKKVSQAVKVAGFLVKVVLKIMENVDPSKYFDEILRFCLTIYSWRTNVFQTNNCPNENVDSLSSLVYSRLIESFVTPMYSDVAFIQKVCGVKNECLHVPKLAFGLLTLINECLSVLHSGRPQVALGDYVLSLVRLALDAIRSCHSQFFLDYNSTFYEALVTNLAVAVLIHPHNYSEIEHLLLQCVTDRRVWSALIATDVWCLVLRHSSVDTCRSTLHTLLKKISELNVGKFAATPATIHLKILTQRIFKNLPKSLLKEELSAYNPAHALSVWKILNAGSMPLSHRHYIEFILDSLYDKADSIQNGGSINDIVVLVEGLDILSHANFNRIDVNTMKLVSLLVWLWSINIHELSPSNNFYRYFVWKLTKITVAVSNDLVGDNVSLILSQLRCLLKEPLFQILCCDMLQAIAKRNFKNFEGKCSLFSMISEILRILVTDTKALTVQKSLEVMHAISEHNNYENVINEILVELSARTAFSNFSLKRAAQAKYVCSYLEQDQNAVFGHKCLEWSDSHLPPMKKRKMEKNVDELIKIVKDDTETLSVALSGRGLDANHRRDVEDVITALTMLLQT